MIQIPAWVDEYVGKPFQEKGRGPGYDCWGLVREVLALEFSVLGLPDYVGAYSSAFDKESVAAAIEKGLLDGWNQVEKPQAGDLVILRLAGKPWHCGVMVSEIDMLHIVAGTNACRERLDSLTWRNRIEGYYRYAR
ncbi:C40 family peptidase [Terriglobus albidus]|uniref:C40 family peptidase n=1 Tax=Terriglobus albidus TaxID=1592106 RepID=UPI0021DFA7C8|nr:C40 family peptidase [Terriglobus albidus]